LDYWHFQVCASDVNDTVVASDGQSDEINTVQDNNDIVTYDNQVNEGNVTTDSNNIDKVSAAEENELSARSGTFTDLANDIANMGDELNLTRNFLFNDENDTNYTEGIVINKKITINGNGNIIDCNNQARAFKILSNNVILNNISFVNGSSKDGGFIYWEGGDGTLHNSSFINCYASWNGGAIYWNGNYGKVSNCSFYKCSDYIGGGAIYWNGNYGSLYNSSFKNCSSTWKGGAIYWNGNYGRLYNSNFKNCHNLNSFSGTRLGGSYLLVWI